LKLDISQSRIFILSYKENSSIGEHLMAKTEA